MASPNPLLLLLNVLICIIITTISSYSYNQSTPLKLHHHHHHRSSSWSSREASFLLSNRKDLLRIQSLSARIKAKTNYTSPTATYPTSAALAGSKNKTIFVATLESGASLGSGEYLIDVFIGTPPRHFSLILDTGSDLNWIQCSPCRRCFHQRGPLYDPHLSSTYRNLTCRDQRCALVSPPDTTRTCADGPCPYFYCYGDRSNTTGDLAVEAFTVNLTNGESHTVGGVVFGCGHRNRGLFRGAAGLLGLGRGPLSFASQLRSLYGHVFSYCLVDRSSDLRVSSKLIFGGTTDRFDMNYTSLTSGENRPNDTFYYVHVESIRVGGESVAIPRKYWEVAEDGTGGTIIDSGTTLSYFVGPAYRAIRDAFLKRVKYPLVGNFPVLSPCYNVSGVGEVSMPGFHVAFADGAVWDFPVENYFVRIGAEDVMCLAVLGTPRSSMSIIGNYQQQNFHILYDTDKSLLGFAPAKCADV